jgi:thioredoxin 1
MIELTDKNFSKEVYDSKIPVLVDFFADWCGPCQMLGPIIHEISEDKDFKNTLKFGKLNTEDYPDLATDNGVQGIPCLIFFKNGKEAARIVGFAPKVTMKAKINSALESINKIK